MTAKKATRKATKPKTPPPPSSEPQDLAERARKMEIKNVVAKLNSGKTLTAKEREILYDYADEQKQGEKLSQSELARRWHITKQAVNKFAKAGMPLTSFEEADDWRNERLENSGRGATNRNLNEAKLENLRLEARKRRVIISRMESEQINKRMAQQVWSEVLVRLSQHVQYMDGMSRDQSSKLCRLLRAEAERIVDELEKCTFEEAEGEDEGDDGDEE